MKYLLLCLCLIIGYKLFFKDKISVQTSTNRSADSNALDDHILVNKSPKFKRLSSKKKIELKRDTLLAHQKVSFRSMYLTKMYRKSDLVPFDLFLGWKEMSNLNFLQNFTINDNELFCHCHLLEEKYNYNNDYSKYITLPSSPKITQKIKSLKKHDLIEIEGYMVHVLNKNGKPRFTDNSNRPVDCLYITKINRI